LSNAIFSRGGKGGILEVYGTTEKVYAVYYFIFISKFRTPIINIFLLVSMKCNFLITHNQAIIIA